MALDTLVVKVVELAYQVSLASGMLVAEMDMLVILVMDTKVDETVFQVLPVWGGSVVMALDILVVKVDAWVYQASLV